MVLPVFSTSLTTCLGLGRTTQGDKQQLRKGNSYLGGMQSSLSGSSAEKGSVVLKEAKCQGYLSVGRTRKPDYPARLRDMLEMGNPHLPGDLRKHI